MHQLSKSQKVISIILKLTVVISVTAGVILSANASSEAFMGGDTVFMYFTIQSNILIGIICLVGGILILTKASALKGLKVWYIIKYMGTVSITLTGTVFCFVLAPQMPDTAWTSQNILTHVVVPLVSVVDFFVVCNVIKIKKINVLWVTVPPILYAIYASIGYVRDWKFLQGHNYPYFFLNWGSEAGAFGFTENVPYMGTVWWILALLGFLIIIGLIYLLIADLIIKLSRKSANCYVEQKTNTPQ